MKTVHVARKMSEPEFNEKNSNEEIKDTGPVFDEATNELKLSYSTEEKKLQISQNIPHAPSAVTNF